MRYIGFADLAGSWESSMKLLGALALLAATLVAPPAALAQRYAPPPPPAYYSSPGYSYPPYYYYEQQGPCPTGYSLQQQDRAAYDCSGTRGRIGLGASPMHPEGPGNVVIPR